MPLSLSNPRLRNFLEALHESQSMQDFPGHLHHLSTLSSHTLPSRRTRLGQPINSTAFEPSEAAFRKNLWISFLPALNEYLPLESPHREDLKHHLDRLNFKSFGCYPSSQREPYEKRGNLKDIYRQIEVQDLSLATLCANPDHGLTILSIDRPDEDFSRKDIQILQALYPVIRGRFQYHLEQLLHHTRELPDGVSRQHLAPIWFSTEGIMLKIPPGTFNVLELVLRWERIQNHSFSEPHKK